MSNQVPGFNLLPGAQPLVGTNQNGWTSGPDQQKSMGLAALAASGNMPSQADFLQRAGLQQAQAAAGAQAVSSRGAFGLAGAQRAAQGTQAGLAQQAVNAGAAQRAQEQQAALSQYIAAAGQQRSQDLQGSGLSIQQANDAATLAQQQQSANQGMSRDLFSAGLGTAMKLGSAAMMFSDERAKVETSYGDMRVGTSHLQEPGGGPSRWTLREEPNFIAAVNDRNGERRKLLTAPLSDHERRVVDAPHGAGPLGNYADAGVGGGGFVTGEPMQSFSAADAGGMGQMRTVGSWPTQPDASWGKMRPVVTDASTARSPVAGVVQIGDPDGAPAGSERASRHARRTDESPITQSASIPEPTSAMLSRSISGIGDIWSNLGKSTPLRPQYQDPDQGQAPGYRPLTPQEVNGDAPPPRVYADATIGSPSAFGSYGTMPDTGPIGDTRIGNVATQVDSEGNWSNPGNDAQPGAGSALAKMALVPTKDHPAWMGGGSVTNEQFDRASVGQLANMSDQQLRDAQAPGGYAAPYVPQVGSLTAKQGGYPTYSGGPSPDAGPVAWVDRSSPQGGVSSGEAMDRLGYAPPPGSSPTAYDTTPSRAYGMSRGRGTGGLASATPPGESGAGLDLKSLGGGWRPVTATGSGIEETPMATYQGQLSPPMEAPMYSDARAKDEAHQEGYMRGIMEATNPANMRDLANMSPYIPPQNGQPAFVMGPHGYVVADPPREPGSAVGFGFTRPGGPMARAVPVDHTHGYSPASIREPVVMSRGGFDQSVPSNDVSIPYADPSQSRNWVEAPFRPESGAMIKRGDLRPGEASGMANILDPRAAVPVDRMPPPTPIAPTSGAPRYEPDPNGRSVPVDSYPIDDSKSETGDTGWNRPDLANIYGSLPEPTITPDKVGMRVPTASHYDLPEDTITTTDTTTSDARAKQLEGQHTGFAAANAFMDGLEPHKYSWRDPSVAPNAGAAKSPNLGVFAQQVEKTPFGASIVQTDPATGYRVLDKSALIGALAASAGALKKSQDDHAMRLEALERAMGNRR